MTQPEAQGARRNTRIDIRAQDVFIKRLLARQTKSELEKKGDRGDLGYPVFYGPNGDG